MVTRSKNSLGSLLGILVLAALLFLLLNTFGVAQVGRFGCGWTPRFNVGAPTAEAASDGCPSSVNAAASDAEWARDRADSIEGKHVTTGLAYDEDGFEHRFVSGQDRDAAKVAEALRQLGFPTDPAGRYPAATHVEAKVANWMRVGGVRTMVLVINNKKGPCRDAAQTCDAVVRALLPADAKIYVWSPNDQVPTVLRGSA